MGFNWEGSVEHYGDALDAIAARLVTMAGIMWGRPVEMLPRRLYLEILSILRPAEFALRRLIVMAAWKVVPDIGLPPANKEGSQLKGGTQNTNPPFSPRGRRCLSGAKADEGDAADKAPSSDPSGHLLSRGEEPGAHQRRATDSGLPLTNREGPQLKDGTNKARVPGFPIFDPWKRYGPPFLAEEQIAALNDPHRVPAPPRPELDPDELVPAGTLCRRVRAFANALLNLDHHIDRMARWRVQRAAELRLPWELRKQRRSSPIRPGVPPGYSERPKTDVGETLMDCHILALDAMNSS